MAEINGEGLPHLTVGDLIRRLLPTGTMPEAETSWDAAPLYPTDLFAATAYLLDVAGAFGRFEPHAAAETSGQHDLHLDETSRIEAIGLGYEWATSEGKMPKGIQTLWQCLNRDSSNEPVSLKKFQDGRCPDWWGHALKLLIASDEACDGIGRPGHPSNDHWFANFLHLKELRHELDELRQHGHQTGQTHSSTVDEGYVTDFRPIHTVAQLVDPDVACVLPKLRVPEVGSTGRNFSRNVALVRNVGAVKSIWKRPSSKERQNKKLNIIIFPTPKLLDGMEFIPITDFNYNKTKWKKFQIQQNWLSYENSLKSVINFIRKSKTMVGDIHGIIFPEFSLNYEIFDNICEITSKEEKNIEFIVAGSSNNCQNQPGNHVVTCTWGQNHSPDNESQRLVMSRRKHHRWRLDSYQLFEYGLASQLDPNFDWWEDHQIGQREVHFHQFRDDSVFTAMICEDLARSDPCHEILRAVGPNLVFVLLMDGPQLPQRWAPRYAATLSDDPGCGVLTLTSFGLIERQNIGARRDSPSNAVAFWRDDTGHGTEINLPRNAEAVLLTFEGTEVSHHTIDGRKDKNTAWRLRNSLPLYPESQ